MREKALTQIIILLLSFFGLAQLVSISVDALIERGFKQGDARGVEEVRQDFRKSCLPWFTDKKRAQVVPDTVLACKAPEWMK